MIVVFGLLAIHFLLLYIFRKFFLRTPLLLFFIIFETIHLISYTIYSKNINFSIMSSFFVFTFWMALFSVMYLKIDLKFPKNLFLKVEGFFSGFIAKNKQLIYALLIINIVMILYDILVNKAISEDFAVKRMAWTENAVNNFLLSFFSFESLNQTILTLSFFYFLFRNENIVFLILFLFLLSLNGLLSGSKVLGGLLPLTFAIPYLYLNPQPRTYKKIFVPLIGFMVPVICFSSLITISIGKNEFNSSKLLNVINMKNINHARSLIFERTLELEALGAIYVDRYFSNEYDYFARDVERLKHHLKLTDIKKPIAPQMLFNHLLGVSPEAYSKYTLVVNIVGCALFNLGEYGFVYCFIVYFLIIIFSLFLGNIIRQRQLIPSVLLSPVMLIAYYNLTTQGFLIEILEDAIARIAKIFLSIFILTFALMTLFAIKHYYQKIKKQREAPN